MIGAFVQYPYARKQDQVRHSTIGFVVQENGCWEWNAALAREWWGAP